jgi:hypothetical protein
VSASAESPAGGASSGALVQHPEQFEHFDEEVTNQNRQLLRQISKSSESTHRRIALTFASYIAMIIAMFGVGLAAFGLAIWQGITAETGTDVGAAGVFGGLSATAFIGTFLSKPVQQMSKAGPQAAWMLAIVNTDWTKVAYQYDLDSVLDDLDSAQEKFSNDMIKYLEHFEERQLSKNRQSQDQSSGVAGKTST